MSNISNICNDIETKGYAVIPDVLSLETCKRLKDLCIQVDGQFGKQVVAEESAKKFHGDSATKMIYNLHNKSLDFLPLIDHEETLPIVTKMLQLNSYKESDPIILKLSTARSPVKGAPAQQLHIDSGIAGTGAPLVMQVIFALDDFTTENGATKVVPGSHKLKEFAADGVRYPEEISLTAKAGSVIIYDGGLWHGSDENHSGADRWGIILTYCRWFIKPSFDAHSNTPFWIYEKMTDRQRELLGFKFAPPKDEFTRLSRRSKDFEPPIKDYELP